MGFLGNTSFGFGTTGSGTGIVVDSANNGLSLSGSTVVLGQTVGQSGNPAALLSNREIPMAGFSILMSGVGNLVIGSATDGGQKFQVIGTTNGVQQLIQLPAGQTIANPIFQVQNSTAVPWFAINTNGPRNIFIGVGVGVLCGTPSGTGGASNNNIGIGGGGVYQLLSTGSQNVAVGNRSCQALTTGTLNTGLGDAALFSLTTGTRNCAIGQASLAFITTTADNIGIGVNAGHGAGSAYSRTIIIGSSAYNSTTGGDDCVIIGTGAAATSGGAAAHGAGNIVMGTNAVQTFTMGANNIIIGFLAHQNNAMVDANISIGAGSSFGVATVSNTTLIGTGMSTSASNIAAFGRADQNVIIGQTTGITDNGAKLQVAGNQSLGVVTSAAGTLNLDAAGTHYVFTGTTATWTLGAVATHTGWFYLIKNRGSGILTLVVTGGGSTIYSTAAVNSFDINPGEAFIVAGDGSFWNIE